MITEAVPISTPVNLQNEVFVVAEEQHEPTTNSDSVVVVAEQHEQVETVVKNQLYIHIGWWFDLIFGV